MKSELLVATRSEDKLDEIRAIVGPVARLEMRTLRDLGIAASPEEDDLEIFPTFVENALAKARYFARLTGMPTLADDSGLLVDALDGGPGVRTKRFALDHGAVPAGTSGKTLDEANNRLLLQKLGDTDQRGAHYMSAVALATPPRELTAVGTVRGDILRAPRGSGGFGYDPLFQLPELQKTFAELTLAEKNAHSHRARAMRAIAPHLR